MSDKNSLNRVVPKNLALWFWDLGKGLILSGLIVSKRSLSVGC